MPKNSGAQAATPDQSAPPDESSSPDHSAPPDRSAPSDRSTPAGPSAPSDRSTPAGPSAPFGRRRQRLTDAETQRRTLEVAMAAVAESGLTVSLDHLRLEDVIREAGVSRTTVYRRWPQKDQFLGDLLLELARASAPMATVGGAEATALIKQTVNTHRAWLDTAEGRAQLAAEVIRVTAWLDFDRIRSAPQWRTYLALTSTFVGLPDGELRSKVQRALAESERVFTERIAVSNRIAAGLLGLRLRPGTGVSFETLAQLANGLLRGLITKSLTMPEIATARTAGTLAGLQADWSLPGLGLAAIVGSFTEPDPDVRWDDARTRALLRTLDGTDDLFDQARPDGPVPS